LFKDRSILRGYVTTEDRVKAVMDWIQENLAYVNNSMARIVDPDTAR